MSCYANDHPGGKEILMKVAGMDATSNFDYVGHSEAAQKVLSTIEVGQLANYVRNPHVPIALVFGSCMLINE